VHDTVCSHFCAWTPENKLQIGWLMHRTAANLVFMQGCGFCVFSTRLGTQVRHALPVCKNTFLHASSQILESVVFGLVARHA
jgi:hypothetical protein